MIFQLLYFELVLFLFRKSWLYILGGKGLFWEIELIFPVEYIVACPLAFHRRNIQDIIDSNAELWCCLVLRKFNIIAETIFMSLYQFCAFFLSPGPKVPTATSWFQRTSRHTLVLVFLLDPATFFWSNFEVQLPGHLPVFFASSSSSFSFPSIVCESLSVCKIITVVNEVY